jgi:hypothetical protein
MTHRIAAGTSLAVMLLFFGSMPAADDLKSGPQVGESIPGPFNPLNVNGPTAGQKQCLV